MEKKDKTINIENSPFKIIKGKVNDDGTRNGLWEYQDSLGEITKGKYTNGLKEGVWIYPKNTYNGRNNILWRTKNLKQYKFNIPSDFNFEEHFFEGNVVTNATWKKSNELNFNIIILEENKKDIETLQKDLILETKKNATIRVLEKKEIKINTLNGIRIIYEYNTKGKENKYLDQYLIKSAKNDCCYLISFFYPKDKNSYSYHQIFAEIAFSFKDKKL